MKYQFTKALLLTLILSSCSAYHIAQMNQEKMEKLKLGMSKEELTSILGKKYTISSKESNGTEITEILSYENFPYDEYYLFEFSNNRLQKWKREFKPTNIENKK
ncbi:outer membrane protein assembly factor BamE [Sphingobacterium rhinopitheci]|uniref:outer membrane protein assembly factor BamE n=1 Tax=Sphingobacterium rhinopitheci TaxID=2781960 RepID=UPI001F523A5E|nr:outer membrane protein assembly factor BamE [Sphingobacterium rhinopitheci]MCI0920384.1 hypothetical protein [Sphingobacterium rhinopitheci]